MRVRRGRGVRAGLWIAGVLAVLLVASQLLLPPLAARVMRQRVGRYGPVLSASIHAFPALELLWGQASSASVRTGGLHLSQAQASDLLWSARGVGSVDALSTSLQLGSLRLSEVHMIKRAAQVRVLGTLTMADLSAALPAGVQLQGLGGGGSAGQLQVRVGGELFGVRASVVAVVAPFEGKLVAEPQGLSLGALTRITLFSDPHLRVQSLALTPQRGGGVQGWGFELRATLG
jgi:LmeA-like phospholipid-binding